MSEPRIYKRAFPVRFDAVDGAGIVYYPKFFDLCHATFEDWFTHEGPLPYPKMITERRLGYPTVSLTSSFAAPLHYGDTANVKLVVLRVGTSSLECEYEIRNDQTKACFQASITTVHMDLDAHESRPHSEDLRSFFETFKVL